jgi:hypothetical protein
MVSDSTFQHVSIRHSGYETQEVLDASFRVLDEVPKIAESVEMFRARKLTPTEARVFAEGAILLRWEDLKSAPIGAEKLLAPRRNEDAGNDLWSVYNRTQENLLRGGQKDYLPLAHDPTDGFYRLRDPNPDAIDPQDGHKSSPAACYR